MNRTRTLAFLFLALFVIGQAQQVTPELFIQSVSGWIKQGSLAEVAQGVRFQAEVGRKAFDQVLAVHKAAPTEVTERWLNTVARAFRLEGHKGPNEALLAENILWPNTQWRGTLFEDDQVVDTRGTVAEKVTEDPKVAGDAFAEALAATHLAVRVGNDFALPSMLGALKTHLEKNPGLPQAGEVKVLEVSALETTGLWSEALRVGQEYSDQVSGQDAVTSNSRCSQRHASSKSRQRSTES